MTDDEFVELCNKGTPLDAANALRKYVQDGQHDGFLDGYTSRAMSRLAADCFKGKFGGNWDYMDFYMFMWGSDEELGDAESRKQRHIRCGMQLDVAV